MGVKLNCTKPIENGLGYEEGAYIASFLGLLPIQSPRFAILAVIDEPKTTIWGSTAAGPYFRCYSYG